MRNDPREPYDDPPISVLEEAILELLENAGIDTETNDKIAELIRDAERRKFYATDH